MSLNTEWVPETGYKSFPAAKQRITSNIIGHYSQIRPHQKNDGMPPNMVEEKYWNAQSSVA
ncbi:hypothetical protein JF535_12100 [Microbulbifer salipaludis]|uniref:Integrase catalytic domain-containing protein n=1 Tax=Microbulbifer salipaludis TaxID=187980 RepID=A0ABS3E8F8_9GAMM|nr:hypothetical protein [Microbulbifer salipaludis]